MVGRDSSIHPMIPEAGARPTLSTSIVVYRSDLTRLRRGLRCLAQALAAACESGHLGSATVIVYDNASPADYATALDELISEMGGLFCAPLALRLFHGEHNVGFGEGNNLALAGRNEDWILVLNPDLELSESALVEGLAFLAIKDSAVAVGPQCRSGDGHREYLCKRYPSVLDLALRGIGAGTWRTPFTRRLSRYEYRDLGDEQAAEVVLLSGACMLMDSAAFRAVGGYHEQFFMYFEDFDLSVRLSRQGTLHYVPSMHVVHHGGQAARKGWRHVSWFVRSAHRFFNRHGWRWY